MSTPAVPDAPPLRGTVISPTAADTIASSDVRAHNFFNVIRDMVRSAKVYVDEGSVDTAITAVDEFEKHILTGGHSSVVTEEDPAPKEDVSQRRAPQTGTAVVPASGPALDYNRLAAAILQMQQHQVDDEPPAEGSN